MVRTFDRGESTVWVMPRDEQMLLWFSIVRIANVQSVRWVLGSLNGQDGPVSTRRAQTWCARMKTAGMVDRAQLGGAGGSLVWATYQGTGLSKPNLYRQTTRHEVAVAAASARYAAAGYAWQRDLKPDSGGGHQADGTALAPGWIELIEVELTGKRMPRYVQIFTSFRRRFDIGDISTVTYLCNADGARAVREALRSLPAGCVIADRINVHEVYDSAGLWAEDELPNWLLTAHAVAARMGR
ncbi:hypothetical protein [Amnibacterium kyonggiense]|uniref:Protein involved in plasmid replication-relaxation n=1 Tax=Amnibacterium kyonggiense TaxID=595671 RepID=A0A4R7FRD6_9MICO|nr:hypothetical protein [Amnibacterium kyonggiense]TDS80371.1 hypothetical protein CLV52_0930 [Amnibacterium kyonggiense]